MATPIKPEMCLTTGRLLTEWFEFPEYTEEQLEEEACRRAGTTPEERPKHKSKAPLMQDLEPYEIDIERKIAAFISARKRTKYHHSMSKQEVQHRMNEATKMVSPDNFKFLPDDVRERTGLEVNPLWLMECLVRSGTLTPKEMVGALKELAGYTHSKAPNISHTTNTEMKPEDWLMELAKEEYKVIDEEALQPRQPVERGAGKQYESKRKRKTAEVEAMHNHSADELAEMEAMIDAEWEEDY